MLEESLKSAVLSELGGINYEKWQRELDQTIKGEITKEYIPVVADRLKMKINITQNFKPWPRGTEI